MSLSLFITQTLTKTRAVEVGDDMTVTITEPGTILSGQVFQPRSGDGAGPDNSPRSGQRWKLWIPAAQDPPEPGARYQIGADEYEVLTAYIERRAATTTFCYEAETRKVSDLYPLTAQLSDLGGAVVDPAVPVAIWEGSESNAGRGTYDNLQAEAPPEFYNALRITNRELVIGSRPFRIVSALLHTDSPHVRMTVRTAD